MAIINIKEGIDYDTKKSFDNQTQEFKDYSTDLFIEIPKLPYPECDSEGNISYSFEDSKLNYTFKRIQMHPNSKTNRAVKEMKHYITVK